MPADFVPRPVTALEILDAIALAERITAAPDHYRGAISLELSRAVLRLRELLAKRSEQELAPGSRIRMSVRLLQDLYEMPGHESVTVRIARTERGADGVNVLLLLPSDEVLS